MLTLNIWGLLHKGLTYDEGRHFEYGANILRGNSSRFDDSKMPVSALNAAPAAIWGGLRGLPISSVFSRPEAVHFGRYVTVLFSLLTAFFVFCWSKELYGLRAGFFSLFLYAFDPNILAHSRLITTDLYGAGTALIALYYFRSFLNNPNGRAAWISGLTLALSQTAKYTNVFLYPLFLMIAGFRDASSAKTRWSSIFGYGFIFVISSLAVINAAYLFNGSFAPLDEYDFKSRLFIVIQNHFSFLGRIPIPLPYPYLEGLDWVKANEENGVGMGLFYLMGETRRAQGFPGYYFIAAAVKMPIALLIFLGLTAAGMIRRFRLIDWARNDLFLVLPIVFFTVYFNFFFNAPMGFRHYLVVLPLLHVACGSLMQSWKTVGKGMRGLYSALITYYALSVLSYGPHFLSYFNELVWDRKQAYKILADSNIDWGENEWYLNEYLIKNPDIQVNPGQPVSGKIVVNVNALTGVMEPPEKYAWLRLYEPVGHVAYSYLVFNVPEINRRPAGETHQP